MRRILRRPELRIVATAIIAKVVRLGHAGNNPPFDDPTIASLSGDVYFSRTRYSAAAM
jgi:hypothetical protein